MAERPVARDALTESLDSVKGGVLMASHNWGDRSGNRAGLPGNWNTIRRTAWSRDNGLCQWIRHDTGHPLLA